MKKIGTALLTTFLAVAPAFAQINKAPVAAFSHGGGNGGDDFELELKKRSLQIGYFLKSSVGTKTFNSINADAVLETINKTDIDVVAGNVVDKYGTIRTCVNEENRGLITCNLDRLNEMKKKGQMDVMTAMLFHEILGMMGIELGYQDNVSMYPISSKILPYYAVIEATPVSEANIRPEYYGIDSASYGITVVNKETKETLRMICLNDNVEIHRCRNYSVVRSANGRQAPLVDRIVSLSPSDLSNINLEIALGNYSYKKKNWKEAYEITSEILNLKKNLSLIGKTQTVKNSLFEIVLEYAAKAVLEKEQIPGRLAKAESDRIEAERRNAAYKIEQERLAAEKKIKDAEAEEQRKIAAWENRKDHEAFSKIGDFSVTFKKDFIALANTDYTSAYNNRIYMNGGYVDIFCSITHSQDSVDRIIPKDTTLKLDASKPLIEQDADGRKVVLSSPAMVDGKIRVILRCSTSTMSAKDITIGSFKAFFQDFFKVNIADPKAIK